MPSKTQRTPKKISSLISSLSLVGLQHDEMGNIRNKQKLIKCYYRFNIKLRS